MIKLNYAEAISYKVAQRARLELQGGDLAANQVSFKLLLAYSKLLRMKASRARLDLTICPWTGRFLAVLYVTSLIPRILGSYASNIRG
jgi:hypothetical protein